MPGNNPDIARIAGSLSEAHRKAFTGFFSDRTSREMIALGLMTKIEGGAIHLVTKRGAQVRALLNTDPGQPDQKGDE